MKDKYKIFTVSLQESILDALKKIDANTFGFLIVVSGLDKFLGVLTDGDIRRAFIRGYTADEKVSTIYNKEAKTISVTDGFEPVIELFKSQGIKFLPILDDEGRLQNIITKSQLHTLLLQDIQADLTYYFSSLNISVVDYEIYQRPWGFYKTTVLNDCYQSKIICVKSGGQLSLQSHNHREEHWIVVHGTGIVQLDQSIVSVSCGSSIFIPKGAKHRLTNTDKNDSLIITEVQIGDYLGEDDIIRYEDRYGRN